MIRIGVTGHRVLADLENIDAAVEKALRRIEDRFPGETLTVISALAEGADRIVANHVLARPGARLVVALPMRKPDYMSDFKAKDSRIEFTELIERAAEIVEMPAATSREQAYEAAGKYVLDNSDVLITIWDGQGAQGRGGTADIVAQARASRLPIAWIHAGNRKPGTHEPASLGNDQGLVTYENL